MSEMTLKHTSCPVVVLAVKVAEIKGDALADGLRDELLAVYLQAGAVSAVVDLQGVRYLSSAGFRPFLSLQRQVRAHGGRLVLCNLGKEVEEIFSVTRLISTVGSSPATFAVQANVPAAVAYLYSAGVTP